MNCMIEEGIFKPKLSKGELKSEATWRAAREILDGEAASRAAKSARLRAARLVREAAEKPVPAAGNVRGKRSSRS